MRRDCDTTTPEDAAAFERAHGEEPDPVRPEDVLDPEELREYYERRREEWWR